MVLRYRTILVAAHLAFAFTAFVAAAGPTARAQASACKEWGASCPTSSRPDRRARQSSACSNAERQTAGVGPLDSNKKLQHAAENHTDRMDGSGCFDHECPGEAESDSACRASTISPGT
jgi:uncharacterized protein YkwD